MLSPRYLDGIADELTELYSQLETDILQRVAKRLKKLGTPTDASEWQAKILAESGGIKGDVAKILKGYLKPIQKQVTTLVTDAINKSVSNDNRIFEKMTGRTVSAPNAQTMLSIIQQTYSDLSRITQTTAFNTEKEFVKQANRAFMNTSSGAFSYSDAMKMACDDLADKGVYTVYYNNGVPVTKSIETAVRMNILTSVNHTAANISLNNCEELDCDLVEVSAHIGARPEHAEWQGQIFSRSGTSKKYKSFDICRLGEIDGLCGINCRHSFYPYFEGMEKVYSDEELKEMNDPARYEQEQKQRYIEKQVRHYKRRAVIEEAGGVDNTKSRVKLGEWQAKAKEHAEKYNLKRDYNREWIGTKDGVQPKGITPKIITPAIRTSVKAPTPTTPSVTTIGASAFTTATKDLNTFVDKAKTTQIMTPVQKAIVVDGKNLAGAKYIKPDVQDINEVIKLQGFDGKPTVLKRDEFIQAVNDDTFIGQRTYTAKDEAQLRSYIDMLRNGDFYVDCRVGGKAHGKGMYVAADYTKGTKLNKIVSEMQHYQKLGEISRGELFTMTETVALHPTAKIINEFDVYPEFVLSYSRYYYNKGLTFNQINTKLIAEGWQHRDIGVMASLLGYDAIRSKGITRADYMVILNRTKVILLGD